MKYIFGVPKVNGQHFEFSWSILGRSVNKFKIKRLIYSPMSLANILEILTPKFLVSFGMDLQKPNLFVFLQHRRYKYYRKR